MIQDVLDLFVWMCAMGAAIAIPMSLRKSVLAFVGWFVFYGLIYWHLTTNGQYMQDKSAGRSRWMPMYCDTTRIKDKREVPALNGMGAFFAPLVLVDRIILHPAKDANPTAHAAAL